MCFSPAASFAVSGVLAVTSVAIAQRKLSRREQAIASMPFFFAIQQFFEGIVWLYLYEPGLMRSVGVYGFVGFAFLFWPVAVPYAMMRFETNPIRKKFISLAFVAGAISSVYYLHLLVTRGADVALVQGCLQYQLAMPWQIGLLYWLGASGALLFSSNIWWVVTGVMITLGALAAALAYPFAIASVWCYFAAITSLIVAIYYFRHRFRK